MGDYDEDGGLYEDANYWWRRKRSRQRVQDMVGQAVSTELDRKLAREADTENRFKASWDKTNALFDPPTDLVSMHRRLGLPIPAVEEPAVQTMADEIGSDEVTDDGPGEGT